MDLILPALGSAALLVWATIWLTLAAIMLISEHSRPVRALKPVPGYAKAGASLKRP